MKLNIYTYIFILLAIGSAFIVANTFGQGLLGTVLAIVFLIIAGITTKQKNGKS